MIFASLLTPGHAPMPWWSVAVVALLVGATTAAGDVSGISWTIRLNESLKDPARLPSPLYTTITIGHYGHNDASEPGSMVLRYDAGTSVAARSTYVDSTNSGAERSEFYWRPSSGIGEPVRYVTPVEHPSLVWEVAVARVEVQLAIVEPRMVLRNVANFGETLEAAAALPLHETLNLYETSLHRSGSRATDPLCTSPLFRCCEGPAPGEYTVHYAAYNTTPIVCSVGNDPTLVDEWGTALTLSASASLTVVPAGGSNPPISPGVVAQTTLNVDMTVYNASSHSASTYVSLADADRGQAHVAGVQVVASAPLVAWLQSSSTVLREMNPFEPSTGTGGVRWCRKGQPDALASTMDPNATAPFFAPSWLFGTARNQIGYTPTQYAQDKECGAPAGYYTSTGSELNAFDQFHPVRRDNRVGELFPACRWPFADPSSGIAFNSADRPTPGSVGTLAELALDCSGIGPLNVNARVEFASAAAGGVQLARRRHFVIRIMDSFHHTAVSTTSNGSLQLAVELCVSLMNVDSHFAPPETLHFEPLGTSCAPPPPSGGCSDLLVNTPGAAWQLRLERVSLQQESGFGTLLASVRHVWDINDPSVFWALLDEGPSALYSTELRVLDTTSLQEATVAVRWTPKGSAEARRDLEQQSANFTVSSKGGEAVPGFVHIPHCKPELRLPDGGCSPAPHTTACLRLYGAGRPTADTWGCAPLPSCSSNSSPVPSLPPLSTPTWVWVGASAALRRQNSSTTSLPPSPPFTHRPDPGAVVAGALLVMLLAASTVFLLAALLRVAMRLKQREESRFREASDGSSTVVWPGFHQSAKHSPVHQGSSSTPFAAISSAMQQQLQAATPQSTSRGVSPYHASFTSRRMHACGRSPFTASYAWTPPPSDTSAGVPFG